MLSSALSLIIKTVFIILIALFVIFWPLIEEGIGYLRYLAIEKRKKLTLLQYLLVLLAIVVLLVAAIYVFPLIERW